MPNAANLESPIVLIGAGRSGTSLVSRIFDLHPDCTTVGETANLIFGPWQAVAVSSASIPPLVEDGAWVSEDVRAGRVVRQTFLTCFPDQQGHWMQKPIGVPKAVLERFDDPASSDAGAWYWRVMRSSFPEARYLAILRHPCDVVLSGRSRWGFANRSLWRSLATLASYLTHPDSPVRYVIRYERLVASPEAEVRAMCTASGLPFVPEMLAGFDDVHVPAPGRQDPASSGYSRREDWGSLDPQHLTPEHRATIDAAFDRFGGRPDWPAHFDAASEIPGATGPTAPSNEVQQLRAQVGQLSSRIERAMFDHAEELRRRDHAWQERERAFEAREKELAALWTEQQAWIRELERVKAWLEQQVAHWRRIAEDTTRARQQATDGE